MARRPGRSPGGRSRSPPGPPGQFIAWLSTEAIDAIDRLPDTARWTLTDDTRVFESRDAIVDGPSVPIDLDQNGDRANPSPVWTGTSPSGHVANDNCLDWENGNTKGRHGRSNATDSAWTDDAASDCNLELRLYCFEI